MREKIRFSPHPRQRMTIHLLAVLSLLFILVPGRVHSQAVITVTSFADDLLQNSNCTLREAVQAANTDEAVDACAAGNGADVILLPQGSYLISIPGSLEDQNATGDLDITSDLTIRGDGASKTIIRMDPGVKDRHLQILPATATVVVEGVTLRDAQYVIFVDMESEPNGGAISNAGTLRVEDVSFLNNLVDAGAAGSGGAIYNQGNLRIINGYFVENDAGGGAGCIDNIGQMSIEGSRFEQNTGYGVGVLYNRRSGTMTISDSHFYNNVHGLGFSVAVNTGTMDINQSNFEGNTGEGMLYNAGTLVVNDSLFSRNESIYEATLQNNGGSLTVRRSVFLSNTSENGGGIHVMAGNPVVIEDSLFRDNNAGRGGGIDIEQGQVAILNSTIEGNQSDDNGGGIANAGASLSIQGSTLSGNTAAGQGGGVYSSGAFNVTNSTISGNQAASGGGIFQQGGAGSLSFVTITANQSSGIAVMGGTLEMRANILAGNQGGSTPDCVTNQPAPITSLGGNLVGVRQNCPWTPAAGDQLGTQANPLVVLMGPLADNGGPTRTHALQAGSIAVDSAGLLNCPQKDQRGFSRPAGAACDSGAFELNASALEGQTIYLPIIGR